jgi:uncharacterized protein
MYNIKFTIGKPFTAITPTQSNKAILSPCIGVCELNAEQLCVGCLRTSAEIGAWSAMSDAQRHYVMDVLLPQREQASR